jgi:hypothetical protein
MVYVMKLSRSSLIATLGCAAAAIALIGTAPALAATSHTTPSGRSAEIRATLKAEIKAQLRYNPSGRVISSTEVSYDHGLVIVTVAIPGAGPDFTCHSGATCIFQGALLTGAHAAISSPVGKNITISQYFNPPTRSIHNERNAASFLSNGAHAACYPPGAEAENIGTPVRNYPYIYLQATGGC